jgi:hypothetical protein
MRKADAEKLEQAVRALGRRKYWPFIGWLSSGCEGDLWEYLRPYRPENDQQEMTKDRARRHRA